MVRCGCGVAPTAFRVAACHARNLSRPVRGPKVDHLQLCLTRALWDRQVRITWQSAFAPKSARMPSRQSPSSNRRPPHPAPVTITSEPQLFEHGGSSVPARSEFVPAGSACSVFMANLAVSNHTAGRCDRCFFGLCAAHRKYQCCQLLPGIYSFYNLWYSIANRLCR